MKLSLLKRIMFIAIIGLSTGHTIGQQSSGPTTMPSSSKLGDRSKNCQTKGVKVEAQYVAPADGSFSVGGQQVNVAHDCSTGQDITCQVIDCSGKTLMVLVHQ
jgi:hypothetical protein